MPVTQRKATGAHFTPPELATLVAERLCELMRELEGPIRVLDPACGDGSLLRAMSNVLTDDLARRVTLIGIENDPNAFGAVSQRRTQFGNCAVDLIQGDFLDFFHDGGLFGSHQQIEPVDVVLANPPYVRTQVLGARRAQELADRFELSGRVDLYQVFLIAMSRQLRPGGLLGAITSNRFLTTRGGMAVRRFLRSSFDVIEIVDLGDTKMFEAAVLPALVFARKRSSLASNGSSVPRFVRIYESARLPLSRAESLGSLTDCLRAPRDGLFRANGLTYRVTTGDLPLPRDDARSWTMLSNSEATWVAKIDAAAAHRLGDVAKVRVGIKTTADDVFIRRDWQLLPEVVRPDNKDLRPLLSQEHAAKWLPLNHSGPALQVLYTHEVAAGKRRTIRFDVDSSTWKYLVEHKQQLESRRYVIDAGREWYEIWVPQHPAAWSLPKIVFPDISPDARFFLDRKGCIVDGNCYWITTNDPDDNDLLLLMLGTVNSELLSQYHDCVFQNKLYSQRRRHLTQYVSEYPLPKRDAPASRKIVELVRRLVTEHFSVNEQRDIATTIDRLVSEAFDVDPLRVTDTLD